MVFCCCCRVVAAAAGSHAVKWERELQFFQIALVFFFAILA